MFMIIGNRLLMGCMPNLFFDGHLVLVLVPRVAITVFLVFCVVPTAGR